MDETYLHNFIYIKGGAYTDVRKALRQWLSIYLEELKPEFEFKLYKKGRGEHAIRADGRLSNTMFFFLVNYLQYPEHDTDFKGKVMGYMRLENWGVELPNELNGLMTQVYVPDNDSRRDEVCVTTVSKESLCYSFTGHLTHKTEGCDVLYELPDVSMEQLQSPYVLNVKKEQDRSNITAERKKDRPLLRFKYGLMVFAFALFLSWFFVGNSRSNLPPNLFLSFGLVMWFFGDYKLLQRKKLYFILLGLSTGFAIYGYFLNRILEESGGAKNVPLFMSLPMLFLLLQKPFRFVFMQLMNREPVVDKPAPSVADFIYMLLLWIALMVALFMAFSFR